jgi:hypothetical protein
VRVPELEVAAHPRQGQIGWYSRRFTPMALQQAHVEDVVETGALWQLQAVGNLADAFQHAERPGVAGAQLALGAGVEGLRRAMEKAQPDPIAYSKLQVAVGGVVVLLGELLCLQETLANFGEDLVVTAKKGISGFCPRRPRGVW